MAYTTINKSKLFMNTITYTANASNNAITGVGHQPDFLITKSRTSAYNPNVYSSVSGVGKFFNGITTGVIGSSTDKIASFDTDGFTLKNGDNSNYNSGGTGVGWSWKAGTSFSNNAGANGASIASTGSVNTTAGFSIISWTNAGSGVATVAHGLGAVPKMIIIKSSNETAGWLTYHEAIGNTHGLFLNTTDPKDDNAEFFNDTSPTSTVFTTGITGLLTGGSNLIAYCFAEKQ